MELFGQLSRAGAMQIVGIVNSNKSSHVMAVPLSVNLAWFVKVFLKQK